ncbi:hypothetical protein ACJJTC_019816 [Scirpophaga incertulas]
MDNQLDDDKIKFKSIKNKISSLTLRAVKDLGFKYMTRIQSEVLPKALDGADIVATAKTGSGKTLAFLIPLVETVVKLQDELKQGTFSIIVSPTRELAIQTYTVLGEIISHHDRITSTIVIGGENRKKQSEKLSQGINIIVATPGRLLDHMRSKEFDYGHVKCLVLDEADKIFQYGFEEDLKKIINLLPKERQTLLFSATTSERTDALVKSAMKNDVTSINTSEDNVTATVEGLNQGYAVCETEYRLWWLHKILKKTQNQKVMVFFSSCKSVVFHHKFFTNYCNMTTLLCIHGKMNQLDRTTTIGKFYDSDKITLFCTDLAARGLDIPAVDWIVQFDPPVGRTARGIDKVGNAVLLLRREEEDFVAYLKGFKIYLNKFESWDKFSNLQPKLDMALSTPEFYNLAVEAYEGYIRALEVRKLKQIFNLLKMDFEKVAKSFGLKEKPDIDIRVGFSKKHRPRKRMASMLTNKDSKQLRKT